MSTIDERWNIVQPTRAFCQKVLPLVYDESLSYMEMVCKMATKLNEVIENNNNLPSYIKELITELVNSDEFTQIVGSVLMDTIINVKFPPTGITPAKGDGVTDDTESIQACLNYANEHGGATVFFPSGKYLTGTLTVNSETSLLGADRYNTTLVLKGGGSTPLLQGVINQSIRNLCLDGNRLNQVEENYLIDGTIEMALFDNVILTDSAHCITSTTFNSNEFANVMIMDIGDSVAITATGNGNLLNNINTTHPINITGENNNIVSKQQYRIDSAEPITYNKPSTLSKYFNYVPATDEDGNSYKILVDNGTDSLEESFENAKGKKYETTQLFAYYQNLTTYDASLTNYTFPQACVMLDETHLLVVLTPQGTFYLPANNNSVCFRTVNVEDGSYTDTIIPNAGHIQDMCIYDGKLYCCQFSTVVNNVAVASNNINVYSLVDYSLIETKTMSFQSTNINYDENTDKFYIRELGTYTTATWGIYDTNFVKNGSFTLEEPSFIKNQKPFGNYWGRQGSFMYGKYLVQCYSAPNTLVFFDLSTNKHIDVLNYPQVLNDVYFAGELESCGIFGDKIYSVFGNELANFCSTITRIALTDLKNGVAANYGGIQYINSIGEKLLTLNINTNSTALNPTGTSSAPFHSIQEALETIFYGKVYNNVNLLVLDTGYQGDINLLNFNKQFQINSNSLTINAGKINCTHCNYINISTITCEEIVISHGVVNLYKVECPTVTVDNCTININVSDITQFNATNCNVYVDKYPTNSVLNSTQVYNSVAMFGDSNAQLSSSFTFPTMRTYALTMQTGSAAVNTDNSNAVFIQYTTTNKRYGLFNRLLANKTFSNYGIIGILQNGALEEFILSLANNTLTIDSHTVYIEGAAYEYPAALPTGYSYGYITGITTMLI